MHRGRAELDAGSSAEQDPALRQALEALVEPLTRGDPMSPLRWTCKSTRQLAEALRQRGHPLSAPTVAVLLHDLGYSLHANTKTLEWTTHPDRDQQFQYINTQVKKYVKHQAPVISVETNKKELVGPDQNPGQEWRRTGRPRHVKVQDFPDKTRGKAIPDGIDDIGPNVGWVTVGCDNDTASVAIESIRRWWMQMSQQRYPKAYKLLICADSGGSNGYRVRMWKRELQQLANAVGLEVTVCHFPPGTSKWHQIEHRLFCHISMNWRGQPLISHEVMVDLIGTTTTKSGLTVTANLDTNAYPIKIKVSHEERASLNIRPHAFHGEWNYTIKPRR